MAPQLKHWQPTYACTPIIAVTGGAATMIMQQTVGDFPKNASVDKASPSFFVGQIEWP